MFSVLLLAGDALPAVARALAALVPAALDGVLGRVVLWAPRDMPGLAELADEAGCELLLGTQLGAALDAARHGRRDTALLALAAGVIMPSGWVEEAIRWRQDAATTGAVLTGPEWGAGWRARVRSASTRHAVLLATPDAEVTVAGGHLQLRKRPTLLAGRFTR